MPLSTYHIMYEKSMKIFNTLNGVFFIKLSQSKPIFTISWIDHGYKVQCIIRTHFLVIVFYIFKTIGRIYCRCNRI